MNANELFARQKMIEAQGTAAPAGATDAASARIIREAQEGLARERLRVRVDQAELLALVQERDLDTFVDFLPHLVLLGWRVANPSAPTPGGGPEVQTWTNVSRAGQPSQDRRVIYVERYLLDKWMASFELVAEKFGYVKKPVPSMSAKRVAGVAVAILLAAIFG